MTFYIQAKIAEIWKCISKYVYSAIVIIILVGLVSLYPISACNSNTHYMGWGKYAEKVYPASCKYYLTNRCELMSKNDVCIKYSQNMSYYNIVCNYNNCQYVMRIDDTNKTYDRIDYPIYFSDVNSCEIYECSGGYATNIAVTFGFLLLVAGPAMAIIILVIFNDDFRNMII